jgi:adenine-specific DNA-methyltransferase
MAVPVPRPRHARAPDGVRLEYPGKRPVDEILATPPGRYAPARGGGDNRLYHADNLPVLAALLADPAVAGRVRLVYIDPPFATAAAFESRAQAHAYDDALVGAAYLESLRARLVLLHRLLADDGSLYLHLDERMAFHARVVLDEVFGAQGYRNCITRKKCNPKNYTRRTYGNVADYVLFYTKTERYVWNRPVAAWDDERAAREYPCVDAQGRRFKRVPLHAPGVRRGETGKPWRGRPPPPGKHWQYPPATLDELDARGEIHWSKAGNPRRRLYLEASAGVPLQDIWTDVRDAHNQNIHVTGYPTEKPPELLARLVAASSDPGDLVLDCFAGSGTTLAAAAALGRRWIGVDRSDEAIATILRRLESGTRRMADLDAADGPPAAAHAPVRDFTLYRPAADALAAS